MKASSKPERTIYVAVALVTTVAIALWFLVAQSVRIPFVYRSKWLAFLLLAYILLGMVTAWTLLRSDLIQKNAALLSSRDRLLGVGGLVIGPLILSYVLLLLLPLVGATLNSSVVERHFTYVSSEQHLRPSRGLLLLKLRDEKGGEHSVVFEVERTDTLDLKCGDTVATRGRESFLGYVVDDAFKSNSTDRPCT